MTLNASRQPKQEHFGTSPDLKRQVGLLAGKTAKRRLNELRSTSRLPRAHHDFLSDHEKHYPDDDEDFEDLHKPMRLSWDEIFVEDMLGMGGFGSVCLVTCPKLRKQREKEEREATNKRNGMTTSIYGDGGDGNDSMNASFAMTVDDSSMGGSMMLSYASSTTATGYNQMLDPNKYYACKSLSNKTIKQANVRGFVQAAADLVQEAFLLSHINPHPNLVRLYGIPVGSIESAFDCGSDASGSDLGYFLILEALGGGILSDKVYDWRQKQVNMLREQNILRKRREQQQMLKKQSLVPPTSPTLNSFLGSPDEQRKSHTGRRNSNASGSKGTNSTGSNGANETNAETLNTTGNPAVYQIPSLEERLDIALQIASGMQHLHAHGIVFRDLKPHNVGLSISYAPNHNNNNNNNNTSNDSSTNGSYATAQSPPSPPQLTQLTWRLFDFGLAREVPVSAFSSISNRTQTMGGAATVTPGGFTKTVYHSEYKTNKNNHNNFTYGYNQSVASSTTATDPSVCYGKAGSLRYMAPETMGGRWMRSSKHQNSCCFATFGSDVYAFSIVLWELVGLSNFDKKYDNNPEEFESAVCDRGHRPAMEALDKAIEMDAGSPNDSPSQQAARKARHANIRELVYACWREDYRQRPNFDFIVATLKEMLPNANHAENETADDIDDNTVATDNLLNESEVDFSFQKPHPPQHHHHHQQSYQHHHPQSYQHHNQALSRMSNHSHMSGSGRSRRRLMRKMSARTLSSRSMLSATSMSNHSMVLEDVFEVETEYSNSAGSNRSSQHKTSSHHGHESLDSDDVDDDSDDESMANDYSIANDSLMNESVITITNRNTASNRYMEYCAECDDEAENENAEFAKDNGEYEYKSYEKKIDDDPQDDSEYQEAPMENANPTATLEGVADEGKAEDKARRKKKSKKSKKSKKKDKTAAAEQIS